MLSGQGPAQAYPSADDVSATRKVGRVFIDLGGKREVAWPGEHHYLMIVRDDLSRFTWLFFLEYKSDASKNFEDSLVSVRSNHEEVTLVRSDDGCESTQQALKRVCARYRINENLMSADSPQYNGRAERTLRLIGTAWLAVRVQDPFIFPSVDVPGCEDLWVEVLAWAVHSRNRAAATADPDSISFYEIWYGKKPPLKHLPLLTSCFHRISQGP